MCTDAYREALTRDLSSPASSAPASTSAPSQRHATEAGREGVVGGRSGVVRIPDRTSGKAAASLPRGAVANSGPAMALAKDATVVNGEAIDQR
jgi:hypothetical protein